MSDSNKERILKVQEDLRDKKQVLLAELGKHITEREDEASVLDKLNEVFRLYRLVGFLEGELLCSQDKVSKKDTPVKKFF